MSGDNRGIVVQGNELNTWISGNRATGNSSAGIAVTFRTTGARLTGNAATGNGVADLYDGNLDPTMGTPACVNAWRLNLFRTDNETGAGFGPGAGCIR